MMKLSKKDIECGTKFHKLTVVKFSHVDSRQNKVYECVCDCGNTVFKSSTRLKSSKNVGCKDCQYKQRRKNNSLEKKLLHRWADILNRCNNKNNKSYNSYGGRGIKVEWETFDDFKVDMLEGFSTELEIDRIDNDGNYSKENCRWVDRKTNSSNRGVFKNSKSGYTGVIFIKRIGKYEVSISHDKQRFILGYYSDIESAVQVRNDYIDDNNLPHKKAIMEEL